MTMPPGTGPGANRRTNLFYRSDVGVLKILDWCGTGRLVIKQVCEGVDDIFGAGGEDLAVEVFVFLRVVREV